MLLSRLCLVTIKLVFSLHVQTRYKHCISSFSLKVNFTDVDGASCMELLSEPFRCESNVLDSLGSVLVT